MIRADGKGRCGQARHLIYVVILDGALVDVSGNHIAGLVLSLTWYRKRRTYVDMASRMYTLRLECSGVFIVLEWPSAFEEPTSPRSSGSKRFRALWGSSSIVLWIG